MSSTAILAFIMLMFALAGLERMHAPEQRESPQWPIWAFLGAAAVGCYVVRVVELE
jgi:hypothetical protein